METESSRSEQVIQDYKRHKLTVSARRRIQDIIQEFERGRVIDARLARIGIFFLLGLIAIALFLCLGTGRVTLS